MRKKGKCIFAHGPIELRVKETRRDRWGTAGFPTLLGSPAPAAALGVNDSAILLRYSGGGKIEIYYYCYISIFLY